MASEKSRRKVKDWRISSVKYESSTQTDTNTSFDDSNERLDAKKPGGTPKFLRTQSSSGILASPRKSRSVTRIFGSLKFTSNNSSSGGSSDSLGASKNSLRDNKNGNCSSLSNLTRLMSPSNHRNTNVPLNQSKSMRSVDQIIDENTEFRLSCANLGVNQSDTMSSSMSNSLEFNMNNLIQSTAMANRLSCRRMQHFRRRSISWDSSQTAKALMRYVLFCVC